MPRAKAAKPKPQPRATFDEVFAAAVAQAGPLREPAEEHERRIAADFDALAMGNPHAADARSTLALLLALLRGERRSARDCEALVRVRLALTGDELDRDEKLRALVAIASRHLATLRSRARQEWSKRPGDDSAQLFARDVRRLGPPFGALTVEQCAAAFRAPPKSGATPAPTARVVAARVVFECAAWRIKSMDNARAAVRSAMKRAPG